MIIAERVVIESETFKFTVDGEDFPWLIDARGPQVECIDNEMYAIGVHIICSKDREFSGVQAQQFKEPITIHGIEFPWAILDDPGLVYTLTRNEPGKVWLKFLAHSVRTDTFIADLRPTYLHEEICDLSGFVQAHPAEG